MCDGPMPMPMRNPNARLKTFSNTVGSRKTGRVAVIWILGWGLGSRDAENLGVVPEFLRSTDSISAFGPNVENAGALYLAFARFSKLHRLRRSFAARRV